MLLVIKMVAEIFKNVHPIISCDMLEVQLRVSYHQVLSSYFSDVNL